MMGLGGGVPGCMIDPPPFPLGGVDLYGTPPTR